MGGRQSLFSLLVLFVREHLKPMSELPMSAVFVYSDARAFAEDMFPPTAGKMRSRFLNANSFLKDRATALGVSSVSSVGDENEIEVEEEAMGCIYDVYSDCSAMYVNLHDAYVAFKARFDGSDDEEEEEEEVKEKEKKKKVKKKKTKKRKGRKSRKEEMSE